MYIRLLFLCFIFKSICGDTNTTSDDIAQRLIDRYNDLTMECVDKNNNTKPAFECSGLMVRGLANIGGREQKYAWSKKPSNVRRNAFSASFLRKDQPFYKLHKNCVSGFIYYPHLKTPSNKYSYRVYCAFPINGQTDIREGEQGCGRNRKDKLGISGSCSAQGINTLTKWTTHFHQLIKKTSLFEIFQCSFDMTNRQEAARNFAVTIEAKKYLRHAYRKYATFHNEIVIKAWNSDYPQKLPIEVFFYIIGNKSGRKKAFQYQTDYLVLTAELIPVVGIGLPTKNDPNLIVIFDKDNPK